MRFSLTVCCSCFWRIILSFERIFIAKKSSLVLRLTSFTTPKAPDPRMRRYSYSVWHASLAGMCSLYFRSKSAFSRCKTSR
uniref:Putative secreted protein n=1 Tax=Anopheles darlingi TaxID=43151 RepID=A0A2M4DNI2_ANODA